MGSRVAAALVLGLALIAAAVALTLTREGPASLARRNADTDQPLISVRTSANYCQAQETLPRGTTAVRLHIAAEYGPRVSVKLLQRGRVIAQGQQAAGWTGKAVTVPVAALPVVKSPVTLCFALALEGDETVSLLGVEAPVALAMRAGEATLAGRLAVEYLRPGRSSWWSLVPAVARRAGIGRALSGTWSVVLVVALMAGVLLACSRLILRELR